MKAELVRCPWCRREGRVGDDALCPSCGGPIALASRRANPDPPPAAPRRVPGSFRRAAAEHADDFFILFGSIWGGVGSIFFVVGLGLCTVMPLLGLIFLPIGVVVGGGGFYLVYRAKKVIGDRVRLLESGVPVLGKLVRIDTEHGFPSERKARVIEYLYEVAGARHGGSARGFDPVITTRRVGEPLWVVVDPDDAGRSEPWPPFA